MRNTIKKSKTTTITIPLQFYRKSKLDLEHSKYIFWNNRN